MSTVKLASVTFLAVWLISVLLIGKPVFAQIASQDNDLAPLYKPSGRSPQAMDIRLPAYGASQTAPLALTIGDKVPDFVVPRAAGGQVSLANLRQRGPVVIVFYRGHW